MSTLMEELTAIKAVEDKLTANKVANFAYTDHAYNNPLTEADGVETYDVDNEQNIPVANASILKVNTTILTKGWRAQASAITRMLMNHFLGRCSYNLNKVNDLFSLLLTKLMAFLGSANGIATLSSDGYVPTGQLDPTGVVKTVNSHSPSNGNVDVSKTDVGLSNVVNTGDSATPVSGGTTKFTTGGAYTLQQAVNGKAPTNHASSTTTYGVASTSNYGHVKASIPFIADLEPLMSSTETVDITHFGIITVTSMSMSSSTVKLKNKTGTTIHLILFYPSSNTGYVHVTLVNEAEHTYTHNAGEEAICFIMPTDTSYSLAKIS